MNILFCHFPYKDVHGNINNQIEGIGLPSFFSKQGHNVFCVFIKGDRKFIYKFLNNTICDIIEEDLLATNFDLIIGKSSCLGSYNKKFLKKGFKINILTLGLSSNISNWDYCFKDDQLIKPPDSSMLDIYIKQYNFAKKSNCIVYNGSMWPEKNQLEFCKLVDPDLVKDFTIQFVGAKKNPQYINKFVNILKYKNIKFDIVGFVDRVKLANIIINSKFSVLCTNTIPYGQPYDPSPRAISESLCAGNPFLIRDTVLTNKSNLSFGYIYKGNNKISLNENLEKMIKEYNINTSKEIFNYNKKFLSMDNACNQAYNDIIKIFNKNK